ncbi:glycosyltransferase family 4 protein [Candidatus Peregrinibacteria bacterium]|nr:glycosyltransferase family 4 protein [Candidatus Peregrinibacteria bacterium]
MNILFTRFPLESTFGGAEVQTLSLMNGLRERGHEVSFLGNCPVLLQRTKESGIKNQELRIGEPPVTKWGAISFLWRRFGMREKIINNFQFSIFNFQLPDAICMLSLTEKLLLTDWAVAHGIRVFWIEHDRIGRWLRWNPWLPQLRRMSKFATTVVVSDLSRRLYEKLGWDPEKIVVIPNGIDVARFVPAKDSTTPHPNPLPPGEGTRSQFRIGCIARLSREKGIDLLIEAIKDLPNIHLTIVGTGRDEGKIQNLIRCLHPEQRITIQRTTNDVAVFYRSLDLFVLPSRDHDPCPLTPIEAMACGVATIMTDACGTAEYVEKGREAIIVPAGSSGALREEIVQLQSDANLRRRLAEHGLQVVAERFSIGRMVDQYEKALRG